MAQYQAGFQAKLRLGVSGANPTLAYAVQRYIIEDLSQEQDVSNTEGLAGNPLTVSATPGFSSYIGGLRRFTASLVNASFDALSNPFAAPFGVVSGSYIAVRLFLNGAAGVSWLCTSLLVNRCSTDGDVRTLQPITIGGVGDGFYSNAAA